jgi:hypothetical protein
LHFGLGLNAQSISNSVDVIEIRDYLHGVQNIAVRETLAAQALDILFPRGSGCPRHGFGEFRERLFTRRKPGANIVVLDVLG